MQATACIAAPSAVLLRMQAKCIDAGNCTRDIYRTEQPGALEKAQICSSLLLFPSFVKFRHCLRVVSCCLMLLQGCSKCCIAVEGLMFQLSPEQQTRICSAASRQHHSAMQGASAQAYAMVDVTVLIQLLLIEVRQDKCWPSRAAQPEHP